MVDSRVLRLSFAVLVAGLASLGRAGEMADFTAAGIPALDHPWAAAEYGATADVLAAGKLRLPTMATVDGAAFVKRLTAEENLALHQDRTLPDSRLAALQKVRLAAGHVFEASALLVTDPKIEPEHLSRLLAALVVTVPKLKSLVPRDDRMSCRRQLERIGSRLKGADLINLGAVVAELEQ